MGRLLRKDRFGLMRSVAFLGHQLRIYYIPHHKTHETKFISTCNKLLVADDKDAGSDVCVVQEQYSSTCEVRLRNGEDGQSHCDFQIISGFCRYIGNI